MNCKMVIFEGPNNSGKSTLKKNVAKITNEKHVLIDRGPISNMVYNTIFQRPLEWFCDFNYMTGELYKKDWVYFVYVTADLKDLLERRDGDETEFIKKEHDLFKKFFQEFPPKNLIIVDTSNVSELACAAMVADKLEECRE